MKKNILFILSLFLINCGPYPEQTVSSDGIKTLESGGSDSTVEFILRPGSDGNWFLYENENHHAKGVVASGVTTYSTYIDVEFIQPFDFVYFFACVPDEKLMKLGYAVGVSGGGSHMQIYLRKEGSSFYTNPHTITNQPWANLNCFSSGGWE